MRKRLKSPRHLLNGCLQSAACSMVMFWLPMKVIRQHGESMRYWYVIQVLLPLPGTGWHTNCIN